MRKVFLDDLPKWESGRYKGKINWKLCIGCKVKFIYDDINDAVEITGYKYPELKIKYKSKDFEIKTYSFLRCRLGVLLGKLIKNHIYNIGEIIKTNTGEVKILEQIRISKENNKRGYVYECCIDNNIGVISEYDLKYGRGCSACGNKTVKGINDISTTHPYFTKYFINIEYASKYSYSSDVYLEFICPDCGSYKKKTQIKTLIKNNGFICPKCSDKKPYPEKFIFNLLRQLGVDFVTEYHCKWSKMKRYDFYIPTLNCIIETHGEQHYNNSFKNIGSRDIKQEKENDELKEQLAKENGIKHYIVINCRKSNIEYIKKHVINSTLSHLFDLTNIDWLKCHEFACSNRVKEICEIWESGINSTLDIANITNLHNSTVRRYLKQGRDLGWCDYDEVKARKSSSEKRKIKVVCLNTLEIFESSKEIEEKYNVHRTDVQRMCKGKGNFISVEDKPYVFAYYDDFINMSEDEKHKKLNIASEMYFKSCIPKKVICLNTLIKYNSIKEASESTNVLQPNISNCCRGVVKYAGKMSNDDKIVWMYYDDYILKSKSEISEIINKAQERKIICLTTNKIFNSISEAGAFYGIKNFSSNIYRCLNNKEKYCGKLKNGEKLRWMYYDEYLNNGENIFIYSHSKKVKCIENGMIFNSVTELSQNSMQIFGEKLTATGISRVCRKERKHYKNYHFEYTDQSY